MAFVAFVAVSVSVPVTVILTVFLTVFLIVILTVIADAAVAPCRAESNRNGHGGPQSAHRAEE